VRKKKSISALFKQLIIIAFAALPATLLGDVFPPSSTSSTMPGSVTPQSEPVSVSWQASPGSVSASAASGSTITAAAGITTTVQLVLVCPKDLSTNGKGPQNFKLQADGMKITLSWDAAPGTATYYNIYRSTDEYREDFIRISRDDIHVYSYIDNSKNSYIRPKQKTKYYYKVISIDQGLITGETGSVYCTPTGPLVPPPADSITYNAFDKKIQLVWDEPESSGDYDLSGFNIFRSTDASSNGNKINTVIVKNYTYDDIGEEDVPLDNGAKYYYKIQSIDSAGNTSDFSVQLFASPRINVSEPKNVTAVVASNESMKLAWDSPENKGTFGLSGYNIFRSSIQGYFPDAPINEKLWPEYKDDNGKVFYFDNIINSTSPPEMGVTYYYKIMPVDTAGNSGNPSAIISKSIEYLQVPQSGLISTEMSQYGLPPESKITISGMKTVDLAYGQVWPNNAFSANVVRGFQPKQELRIKLQGQIGTKIIVDVDYDDNAVEAERKKISIKYLGSKDETVQEAAFGDITLTLPQTRFVGYSQSLFGIEAKVNIGGDKLSLMGIAAQTKGIDATQTFTGNLRYYEVNGKRGIDIYDTAFIKNKYYYIDPGMPAGYTIKPGSIQVWVNDEIASDDNQNTVHGYDPQILGSNFTVDYKNGIIMFSSPISDYYQIVACYQELDSNGNVSSRSIAIPGNQDFATGTLNFIQNGYGDLSHKVMNYYYLNATQIYNPASDPGFIIRIYPKGNASSPTDLPQPSSANSAQIYSIDTALGILKFTPRYPIPFAYSSANSPPTYVPQQTQGTPVSGAADCYNVYGPQSNYYMHVEFQYYVSSYVLDHSPVVLGSERVYLDNKLLKKDVDYYMFYETGEIQFYDKTLIQPNSQVTVTYEYSPFLQTYENNLLGGRMEYKMLDNLNLGSTFLWKESNTEGDLAPDARSTATSLSTPYRMFIIDANATFTLGKDQINQVFSSLPLIGKTDLPLSLTTNAEIAQSDFDINIFDRNNESGVAMIDSMQGVDNVYSTSMDKFQWLPSSQPLNAPGTENSNRLAIVRTSKVEQGHTTTVTQSNGQVVPYTPTILTYSYNGLDNNHWDGIRYVVSPHGQDFHTYNYLEMWVYINTDNPVNLNVDVGVISEDSAGDPTHLYTEDQNGNGILQGNEDTGIRALINGTWVLPAFNNGDSIYWGQGAGADLNVPVTEDINANGSVDVTNAYYEYAPFAGVNQHNELQLSGSGWRNFKIPLRDYAYAYNVQGDATQTTFMSNVQAIRVWLTGSGAQPSNGYVKFETCQLTGNSWQLQVENGAKDGAGNIITTPDTTKLNAVSVSQAINPNIGYVPNTEFFDYQTTTDLQSQQALELDYNITNLDLDSNGQPIYIVTKSLSDTVGYDYASYQYLKFDVFYKNKDPNNHGKIFFMRLGSGTSTDLQPNYYQYNVVLDTIPNDNGWHTITIALDGSDGTRSTAMGMPNLRAVNYIIMGVINPTNQSMPETIFIDNIRLTDPKPRVGMGKYEGTIVNYAGFGTLTQEYEERDTDFYTTVDVDSAQTKQHSIRNTVDFLYSQISFLSLDTNFTKQQYYTEDKYRDDLLYTNNFLNPDQVNQGVTNKLGFNLIPGLTFVNNTSFNNIANDYLSYYNVENNISQVFMLHPNAQYTTTNLLLPGGLKIPLGSNSLSADYLWKNTYTNYNNLSTTVMIGNTPTALSAYCPTCYTQWNIHREQLYSWKDTINANIFSITPSYAFKLIDERGNLASDFQYYQDALNNAEYFTDKFLVLHRENAPALSIAVPKLWIFSPKLDYSSSEVRDYSQGTLNVNNTTQFSSGLGLSSLTNQLVSDLNYSLKVNTTAYYNDAQGIGYATNAYSNSTYLFYSMPFESQWGLMEWKMPFNKNFNNLGGNEMQRFECSSNSDSITISNTFGLTAQKILSYLSITPSLTMSTQRNAVSRILSGIQYQTIVSITPITIGKITLIKGLMEDQTISAGYTNTRNQSIDPTDPALRSISSDSMQQTANLTVPYAMKDGVNGSLGMNGTWSNTRLLDVSSWSNVISPIFNLNYVLKLVKPIPIPAFIPWIGGKELKLTQDINLNSSLEYDRTRGGGVGDNGVNSKLADTYKISLSADYRFMQNVEGKLTFGYSKNIDDIQHQNSYDSIMVDVYFRVDF